MLGFGENFRDLAWAKKFGMANVRGTLRQLQGDIERGASRRIGAAPTEVEREAETSRELLEVWEAERGVVSPTDDVPEEDKFAVPSFPTEPPPEGYRWELNELNQWVPTLDPFAAREPTTFARPDGAPSDSFGRTAVWSERLGAWDYPPNWGQPPTGYVSPFEEEQAATRAQEAQQQFQLQQQQAQQQARWQEEQAALKREQMAGFPAPGGAPTDPYGRTATWDADNAEWRYPPDWGTDPATLAAGYISPYQEQQIGIQQQQVEQQAQQQAWQQAEAQRQYGAQLAAQPQSWLQYAAYTGEQPAIQPWMQPLMPQQYEQLGAGAAIPGWQAQQAGQMGGAQGMAGLPELTRPSRQYQARMGPTAQQQYLGYQQARTGVRPEEEQWRLWSGAPPGGQHQGLRYTR